MNYASLSAAIQTWSEREYSNAQIDEFIELSEAWFNRKLGPNFRRETTSTITLDASGEGALPSGFTGMVSLTRDLNGSVPLKQVSWDALIQRNPYAFSHDAEVYAFKGATIKVAPVTEDDYIAVHWAKLTGLSSSNTSNWLLADHPDVYLHACLAQVYAFEEDEARSEKYLGLSAAILDEIRAQADVARYSNAELTLDMAAP